MFGLLGTMRVAMCTRAQRTCSVVLFISLMVNTCKLCVLFANYSKIDVSISTLAMNSENLSCVSPSAEIKLTINCKSSLRTSCEQSSVFIFTLVIGLFFNFLRIIFCIFYSEQTISPERIVYSLNSMMPLMTLLYCSGLIVAAKITKKNILLGNMSEEFETRQE